MYYHTPDMSGYVRFIKRFRHLIIFLYILLSAVALWKFQPEFISSDEFLWLNASSEYKRTTGQSYSTDYISKLEITIDHPLDDNTKDALQKLQKDLENHPHISRVDSIFSSHYIYNDDAGKDSSMVKAAGMSDLSAAQMKQLLISLKLPYKRYTDSSFNSFSFYLFSDAPIRISEMKIPFKYHYAQDTSRENLQNYLYYTVLSILAVIVLFRIVFQNFISALSALAIITLTAIGTFTIVWLLTGIEQIFIAMILIVISIAMVDFLYFYYRWHVSQYKADGDRALHKTLNRNIAPAFWTSLITLLGLGSLLFIDSTIVKLLSMNVIFASTLAYILNMTLLPSILSYFEVKHPKVSFGRYCYAFAKNEMHYNKRFLKLFLAATSLVILTGSYELITTPERLFAHHVKEGIITVKVPYQVMDVELIKSIRKLEESLKHDIAGIGEIESVASVLAQINYANTQSKICDEQNLMQALFFIELYDLDQNLLDDEALNITIHLNKADKIEVMQWLQRYKGLDLYFTDRDTLLNSAKIDKSVMLGISLASALVMIGLIIGGIFRNKDLIWIGFIANTIPIAWFGLIIELLRIPLSLEVLIAMTITVGLTSDATVHFAFKYFRSRYYGRTQKHALEIMFFYAGIPVIIGALILISVFALLSQTEIVSLQLIGGYGALLMVLSLLTDLFILPVLLLSIDKGAEDIE